MAFRQPKRFRGGFRSSKFRQNEDAQFSGGQEEAPERHPSHLRGKEIGLFYAKRNKARREADPEYTKRVTKKRNRPLGKIMLSESKKEEITRLLDLNAMGSTHIKTDTYDHLQDSSFKRNFLSVIQGNIQEKLENGIAMEQNADVDCEILREFLIKQRNPYYKAMLGKRMKLPSYDRRQEIVQIINKYQVCVISGETGCGKTTQIAQFILDDHIENEKASLCKIFCTQPRRISAISIAHRVADERAEKLGNSVGYQIRLEKILPREVASITFCTTGVILKLMEKDPNLSSVSHLILDEIHERDIMSDFLITLMKKVITQRNDIKLILMSATLNSEHFARYFDNCELLHVPGFTYHVEEYFLEDVLERTRFAFEENQKSSKYQMHRKHQLEEFSKFIEPSVRQLEAEKKYSRHTTIQMRNPSSEELNLDLVLALLIDICIKETESGAILVFLPGYADISNLNKKMEASGKFPKSQYLTLPLHSQMPTVDQRQIFDTPPKGIRKIILSTNITETSVTIDDVVFVVDCGRIKIKNYDVDTNTQSLNVQWVSLANASQRRGRAGRVKPGICFHLYSRARQLLLDKYIKPEILRTRLEDVVLTIKVLQLGKASEFLASLIDPPNPEAVALAVELLQRLNALDEDENLTPLGYHLARLPMAPQMGKMILLGALFSCLDPILSVAASLDFKDAFQLPLGKEREVDERKLELSNGIKSDHLLYHYALLGFERAGSNARRFCYEHFLSSHTLNLLQNMKKQFTEYLYEMEFVPEPDPKCHACNRNSDNLSLVKAIICAGLYPNVAVARNIGKFRRLYYTMKHERLEIHPRSILNRAESMESPLIVYYLRLKSSSDFIHDATCIHALPLIFFGDKFVQTMDNDFNCISVNEGLKFNCSESTTAIILRLRKRLNWFLEYKVSHPGFVNWLARNPEVAVLKAIMELITSEDVGEVDLDAFDDNE